MDESRGDAESIVVSDIDGGVGELIADKYRVIRALGHGSSGTVYLCEHTALEKQVAVKVLHRDLTDNAGLVARFQREAQTAARLDHPNSVHVMDFGQDAHGTLYLAMEYVEGRDLGELLNREAPLSDERVVDIMLQVLSALSAAHALGIVHRDLKPENILVRRVGDGLDEEQIKVCDFGIAQLSPIRLAKAGQPNAHMPERVTGDGMVVGTPAYMSPEQARALTLDARSDLYSAGVVLFQLLTRTLPFVADTPLSVAVMHCTTPPPPPSGYGPVNRALEAVCLKALSKTRDARYQSASEMQAALLAALAAPAAGRAIVRRSLTPLTGRKALLPSVAGQAEVEPWPSASRKSKPGTALATQSSTRRERSEGRTNPGSRKGKAKRGAQRQASAPPKQLTRGSVSSAMSVAPTELSVPAVRNAQGTQRRRRAASLLIVAVTASLLALVAMPSFLPNKAETSTPVHVVSSRPLAMPAPPPAPLALPASEPSSPNALVQPESVAIESSEARAVSVLASAAPPAHARRSPTTRLHKPAAIEEQPTASDGPSVGLPSDESNVGIHLPTDYADTALEPLAAAKVIEVKPSPSAEVIALPAPQPTAASVAPATPAPHPVEVAPAPAAVSGGHGQVTFGALQTHGVPKASLRTALNQAALTRCYQDAQRRGLPESASGSVTLELATNMSGHVSSVHLSEGMPKALRECIEQVARSGHVRDVDTGEAQATIELKFQP